MNIILQNGSYAYSAATLECDTCEAVFMSSDGDHLLDLETLVGRIQVHGHTCGGAPVPSENLWHRLCGSPLTHRRDNDRIHNCDFCHRTVPEAEQIFHAILWKSFVSLNFRPGCVCGWESSHGHMQERDASAEWKQHTRRAHQ